MHLSRLRVEGVAEYLTDNFNINSDILPILCMARPIRSPTTLQQMGGPRIDVPKF